MVKEMLPNNTSDKVTLNNQLQDDILSIVIELLKVENRKNQVTTLYTGKQDQHIKDLNSFLSKKKLRGIVSASKQLKLSFSWVGLFAVIIAPSDEFILVVCFIVFVCIFSFFASSYITTNIDSKLLEIKERFLVLTELQKEHKQLQLDTIAAIRGINTDKKKLFITTISKLNLYTRISKESYSFVKLSTTELTLEGKLNSAYILAIQKYMRSVIVPNRLSNIPEPSLLGHNLLPLSNNKNTNARILLELSKLGEYIYI
jgi:hypothetical protein